MQLFRGERQLLDRYLAPDMRVLDLGSGSGRVTKHIAAAGARVWACDLNATGAATEIEHPHVRGQIAVE